MEPTQPEQTLEESIAQVMQTLPPVIRAYLAQGKYTAVAKALAAKYRLRIDQVGVLEREIMLLLMGVETPDAFMQALIEEAGLDQAVVDNIAHDVNDQIFIPLREEERRAGPAVPETKSSPAIPKVEPQMRTAQSAKSTQGAPLPPRVMMPARPALAVPSSLDASRLLEDHEEPHIEINTKPAAQPAPQSVPPPNLPGTTPEVPSSPRPAASPSGAGPAIPKAEPPRPATVITAYTSDPYREPIDETK